MGLRQTDYRKVLSVIDELGSSPDPEAFMDRTVRLVHGLVPCDQVSFSESDPDRRVELAGTAWPVPQWTEEMEIVYWTYSHQNPLCDALAHDGEAHLRRMSDVVDRRGLHRLDFYHESLHPNGVEYDLMMQLPWGVGRCRAVELSRADRDFSERDVEVLTTLQPHLINGYRDSQDRRRLRQAVMHLENAGDAEGIGLAILGPGRRSVEATPRARAQLAEFFDSQGSRLPEELDRWITEQVGGEGDVHEPLRRPLLVERGERRLRVSFVTSPWGDHLLFEERVTVPPEPDPALGLTPREIEVLLLISQGLTNRQAARRLSVTSNTVRKHLENTYAKLGVGTRTAAIAKTFGEPSSR